MNPRNVSDDFHDEIRDEELLDEGEELREEVVDEKHWRQALKVIRNL